MSITVYESIQQQLRESPKTWLITGVAGFIGSNLLETLLLLDQYVIGLDNLSTGHKRNLEEVKDIVGLNRWKKFRFIEGDISELSNCENACLGVDIVLHQAALGSVPRSLHDPITTNKANVNGFLNMIVAARDAKVDAFVYAASSSTYGDLEELPKVEHRIGSPISPYAVTKYVNELYADVFSRNYNFHTIGLRYFNVFGRRQDPNGAYAAVIPKWIAALIKEEPVYINGDGETSRDFCYVDNVIQANILAAMTKLDRHEVFNIAVGDRTSLNELYNYLIQAINKSGKSISCKPIYKPFRKADVRHSQADINKARDILMYSPTHRCMEGIKEIIDWYIKRISTE